MHDLSAISIKNYSRNYIQLHILYVIHLKILTKAPAPLIICLSVQNAIPQFAMHSARNELQKHRERTSIRKPCPHHARIRPKFCGISCGNARKLTTVIVNAALKLPTITARARAQRSELKERRRPAE